MQVRFIDTLPLSQWVKFGVSWRKLVPGSLWDLSFFLFPEIFRDFQRFFSVKTDLPFFHESKISETQWGHAIRRSCWISVVSWWTRTSPLLARRKKRGLGMTIKGGSRVLCGASRRKDASQRRPPSSNVEQVVGSYGACKRC
jgi:hypothetical protein